MEELRRRMPKSQDQDGVIHFCGTFSEWSETQESELVEVHCECWPGAKATIADMTLVEKVLTHWEKEEWR
jgi:hypothetical protein